MRCLVTGASGFIGANLCRRLLKDGHEVHALLRSGYSTWRLDEISGSINVHRSDLCDRRLAGIVKEISPEWVFHLAAYGAYSSQTDFRRMAKTNITGLVNLCESCLATGFKSFVNTGSSSEYGFKNHKPSEDELLEPNSHYAITKASATNYCRYVARSRNVNMPTLRLYSVYGPFEEPARLMPALIVRGLDKELPPLVNPDVARDYIYIDDVISAYLRAAEQPGRELGAIYNVGTGIQTTMLQVVDVAKNILGITVEAQWGTMPNRKWDTNIWVSDNRKIIRELGWQPEIEFPEGFRLTADWLRNNRAMLKYYKRKVRYNP
jgi:UDP-glucose 4-epimerase